MGGISGRNSGEHVEEDSSIPKEQEKNRNGSSYVGFHGSWPRINE